MKRRNTPQKELIINLFRDRQAGICQDEVESMMEGMMNKVTIYRILNRFCEDGIMHKITDGCGKAFFVLQQNTTSCTKTSHHHFHCVRCNQMVCIANRIELDLEEDFTILQTNCLITGICPKCKK